MEARKKEKLFFNENENCEKLFGKLISDIILFSDLSNGKGKIRKDSIKEEKIFIKVCRQFLQ